MTQITLTKDQQDTLLAFTSFLSDPDQKYLIIQGAAGCGKSTLISHLMQALEAQYKMYELLLQTNKNQSKFEVCISATTNQAVSVLEELTGREATTIHSLLGLKVVNNTRTGKTELQRKKEWSALYNKLFIIDEASMIDEELMYEIDRTAKNSKVVLIGDEWQLAPVGQIDPTMSTLVAPKVTMNKILRNSGAIQKTGAQFRESAETGVFKPIPADPAVQKVSGPDFQKLIDAAFLDPGYETNAIKVLAWTNKRVQQYNAHIRSIKNLPALLQVGEYAVTNNQIVSRGYAFKTDSFVEITDASAEEKQHDVLGRQIEIANTVTGFMANNPVDQEMLLKRLARKKDWTSFFTIKETWFDLRPAYASTVHKAQGRTYDTVFIDLADIGRCANPSDVARMLYVAISRAKNQVYLYGDLPAHYGG